MAPDQSTATRETMKTIKKQPKPYGLWWPPWKWDWQQWVFVLALELWINLMILIGSGNLDKVMHWIPGP